MAKTPYRRNPQSNLNTFTAKAPERNPPQDWRAYNKTQTNEKLLFMQFLSELVDTLEEPEHKSGRKPISLRDMIFCCALVKYLGFSSRRAISDIELARNKGYIKHKPHFNSILNYLNKPELELILKRLIVLSSLPLAQFEDVIAVDASGFGTSLYRHWSERREYRKTRVKAYKKVHLSSGVKTNIITAAIITKGYSPDVTYFESLVRVTSKNFNLREVLADRGYTSKKNMQLCWDIGAIPFIPFKKNANGKAKGSIAWSKMFKFFNNNYDLFLRHYHMRSNVESTFSMIKRKFGTRIRSRTDVSQKNEILLICLAHNLVVLIAEVFEHGIFPDFENLCKKADCTLIG